jgi:hypothetical protein
VRFAFRPPAAHAAGLLSLPWELPLEEWVDDRLLEVAHRGISLHAEHADGAAERRRAAGGMNAPICGFYC